MHTQFVGDSGERKKVEENRDDDDTAADAQKAGNDTSQRTGDGEDDGKEE